MIPDSPPGFDLFTLLTDPHPHLDAARAEAPIFRDEATGHWVVTRYETIKAALSDPETYSSVNALEPITPLDPAVPAILEAGGFGARPFIVNIDGEDHRERKRIFTSVLHPRKVAQFEPRIRALAKRMLGDLPMDEPFDLVDRFSLDFPALVVFAFLGIPDDDVREIKGWADARMELFFGDLSSARQRQQAEGIVRFWRYIEDHIESQLADPGDHFVGDLVRLHRSGDEDVSLNDIANYCWSFLFAGHETTTAQITNMVRDLLVDGAAWSALVADPSLAAAAAEESLRMNTSVFNWRRRTTREVQLHGVTVPAGSDLFLVYGSANHDAAQFPEPDRFVLDRPEVRRHLGLGHGAHFCVGAGLARLQLRIVLEELVAVAPDLRLVPDRPSRFIRNVSFCGPRTLWLERSP
ncbi:MAG: cytochrome P450 [Actinomycetota bacterium]